MGVNVRRTSVEPLLRVASVLYVLSPFKTHFTDGKLEGRAHIISTHHFPCHLLCSCAHLGTCSSLPGAWLSAPHVRHQCQGGKAPGRMMNGDWRLNTPGSSHVRWGNSEVSPTPLLSVAGQVWTPGAHSNDLLLNALFLGSSPSHLTPWTTPQMH